LAHSECLEIVAQQHGFSQWNTLAAKLNVEAGRFNQPEDPFVSLQPPIPIVPVTSLQAAVPFYVDFLGFQNDWGFDEGSTYAQISRSESSLHLDADSQSRGHTKMLIRMAGLDSLHRELSAKAGPFAPGNIIFTPWDSRVFHVTDPFGNELRFWENNPPGISR
jgi:predicted enzyme related to lactoylglutathione lyase